ncbi:MAG TPA: hypothetical protein VMK12_09260 [Anaeromyxobacteraceae bacterium]|nr:hypothetical protein [Anaeromyxobacteraceae bacterium]
MSRFLRPACAFGAMVLASCGTTKPVQVWRDATYEPTPPAHRILVFENTSDTEDPVARGNSLALETAIARALSSKGLQVATSTAVFPSGPANDERVGAFARAHDVDLVLVLQGHIDDFSPVDPAPYTYFTGDVKVYTAQLYPDRPIWIGRVGTFTPYALNSYGPGSGTPVLQPESVLESIAEPVAARILRSLIKHQILVL